MWNRTKSECEKSKVIFKRRVVTPAHIMPNAVLRCISPLPPPIFSLILGLIQFPSDRLSHADAVSITTRGQTQAFINQWHRCLLIMHVAYQAPHPFTQAFPSTLPSVPRRAHTGPLNFHLHIIALIKLLSAREGDGKQVRKKEREGERDGKQATEGSDMSATEIS